MISDEGTCDALRKDQTMPSPSRLSTKPEKEMSVAAKKKADHQWTRYM